VLPRREERQRGGSGGNKNIKAGFKEVKEKKKKKEKALTVRLVSVCLATVCLPALPSARLTLALLLLSTLRFVFEIFRTIIGETVTRDPLI